MVGRQPLGADRTGAMRKERHDHIEVRFLGAGQADEFGGAVGDVHPSQGAVVGQRLFHGRAIGCGGRQGEG